MKVVIDTNVFVSSLIGSTEPIQHILDACLKKQIQLILSKPILRELDEVLHRPGIQRLHKLSDEEIKRHLADWQAIAEVVSGSVPVSVSPDPDDNMLFAAAVEGKADYLISGNTKHVLIVPAYERVKTISPRDFVEHVLQQKKAA